MLGLAITNSLYTHPGWSPTFVAYTSMAPSLVLYFGGGWKKVLTSGIISGVTTYPLANFLFLHLSLPLGVAGFTGIALGMGIMVIVMTEICRFLPWMVQPSLTETSEPKNATNPMQEMTSASYYFGRLLSDAGETVFWGTPVAVIGLYSGALLSWVLNPFSLVSGSGRFPIVLLGTTLAIALAVFYWYPRYYQKGYAFTFATVLFSSAILTSYALSPLGFVLTIVVASLVNPFATHFLIDNLSITKRWHPCPTMLLSTGILTGVWSLLLLSLPYLLVK